MDVLKEIDSVAKFITEDPMRKQGLWHFPSKKSPEGRSAEIMVILPVFRSMKDVTGTVDNLGKKMEGT